MNEVSVMFGGKYTLDALGIEMFAVLKQTCPSREVTRGFPKGFATTLTMPYKP